MASWYSLQSNPFGIVFRSPAVVRKSEPICEQNLQKKGDNIGVGWIPSKNGTPIHHGPSNLFKTNWVWKTCCSEVGLGGGPLHRLHKLQEKFHGEETFFASHVSHLVLWFAYACPKPKTNTFDTHTHRPTWWKHLLWRKWTCWISIAWK